MSLLLVLAAAPFVPGCPAPNVAEAGRPDLSSLEILSLRAPAPLLEGTVIRVSPRGLRGPATLRLEHDGNVVDLSSTGSEGSDVLFLVSPEVFSTLGEGERALDVTLRDGVDKSTRWRWPVELARSVSVRAPSIASGVVGWDDTLVVSSSGLIFPTEGTQDLVMEGWFDADSGERLEVLASFPMTPIEPSSRTRATFVLAPLFGTLEAGMFTGEARIETVLNGGFEPSAPADSLTLDIRPAAVLDVTPTSFSVGEYVEVVGTGFVDSPGRAVLVRLVGRFTHERGFEDLDLTLVPEWLPRSRLRLMVEPAVSDGRVISSWFGQVHGGFVGEVSVVMSGAGQPTVETTALDVTLLLEAPKQIVWVRLLPGFDASLDRFGLRAARGLVVERAVAHMAELYRGYRVEFVLDEPTEYAPIVVSTLEIGGPDPNGLGLLGYDNSPGKDVGNVRMADAIGGANAAVQADGTPGYGGVFIESFLYWSSHPDLGTRPEDSPPEDALFDALFDPVRDRAATLSEVRGEGEAERVAAVAEAIRVLGNLIGETAAHEVGHSLGLADPFGPPSSFHNAFDAPGCLMDAGADRPFGERAALPGFAATTFCGDSAAYLDDVLRR